MTLFADPFAELQNAANARAALAMTRDHLQALLDSIPSTIGDAPDRTIRLNLKCFGVVGDEDDHEYQAACDFEGDVDVAVFNDTEEALWYCPEHDHENSIPFSQVPA